MRLAISNIAWPSGADAVVKPLLRKHGVEGVELALTKVWPEPLAATVDEVRAYRASWERDGFRIVALQALLFGKPEWTIFEDVSTRRHTLERLSGMIERAAWLGAGVLVFGSPKNRRRGVLSETEARSVAVPFFRELGALARRHGVRFCIEPNPPVYGCDFVTNTAEGIALVDAVDEEGFALHLDSAALHFAGDSPAESFAAATTRCRHFHVSEPFLAEIGSGDVVHDACSRALAACGYEGWISIEMSEKQETGEWSASVERALTFTRSVYVDRQEK